MSFEVQATFLFYKTLLDLHCYSKSVFFLCPSPSPFITSSHLFLLNHETLCPSMERRYVELEKKKALRIKTAVTAIYLQTHIFSRGACHL